MVSVLLEQTGQVLVAGLYGPATQEASQGFGQQALSHLWLSGLAQGCLSSGFEDRVADLPGQSSADGDRRRCVGVLGVEHRDGDELQVDGD